MVWCGVVWCGGELWCSVVWCGVVWCGVVRFGVMRWGVVWCGVMWCSEMYWYVVWFDGRWPGVAVICSCYSVLKGSNVCQVLAFTRFSNSICVRCIGHQL